VNFVCKKVFCLFKKSLDEKKYCCHHSQALDDIMEHYKKWVHAYEIISWNDFLNKLLNMNETGSWIKEVIAVELKR
jgi:hypothetical protein